MKKFLWAGMCTLSLLAAFAGCQNGSSGKPDSAGSSRVSAAASQHPGSSGSPGPSAGSAVSQSRSGTVSIEKSDLLSGARALGWLDDDTLLCVKKNAGLPKVYGIAPESLYLHDVLTGADTVFLAQKGTDIQDAKLSPDKAYVAYEYADINRDDNAPSALGVMNVKTKARTILHTDSSFNSLFIRWLDDDHLLYNWDWRTYLTDLSGNKTDFTKKTGYYFYGSYVALVNGVLYYIDVPKQSPVGGKLIALRMDTGSKKTLMNDVGGFAFSPDRRSILVNTQTASGEQLEIVDPNGSVLRKIWSGPTLLTVRMEWSPQQRYLAYTLNEKREAGGCYLYDTVSGTTLKIESAHGSDYDAFILWSPSGDELLPDNILSEENRIYHLSMP